MVEMVNRAYRAEGVDRVATLESLNSIYEHLDRCDPVCDIVVAEAEGRVVGCARTTWSDDVQAGRCYYDVGTVDPNYWGHGIGTAMFERIADRIQEIATEHRAGPKWLESWAYESQTSRIALLEAQGLDRVAYEVQMVRPTLGGIADAQLPESFVVRTPSEAELRAVWEADIDAFREHWGFTERTEVDYERFLRFPWNDRTLWRVAWEGDVVAGQVRSYIDPVENDAMGRKRGYTESISVRSPYRGRGLARALLTQSLHAIRERGMEEAALGVHVDNAHGAFRLYESVGFEPVATLCIWRKPLE